MVDFFFPDLPCKLCLILSSLFLAAQLLTTKSLLVRGGFTLRWVSLWIVVMLRWFMMLSVCWPFGFVALVGVVGLTVVQVSIFLFQILICFLKTCVFDFVSILIWETLNIIFIVLDIFCALPSLFSVFYTLLFLWNHWLTALTIWPEWFGLNSWNFKMKGRKGWRWLTGFVGNGNLVRVMREEN